MEGLHQPHACLAGSFALLLRLPPYAHSAKQPLGPPLLPRVGGTCSPKPSAAPLRWSTLRLPLDPRHPCDTKGCIPPKITPSHVMSSAHSFSMPIPNLSPLAHPSMSFFPSSLFAVLKPSCRSPHSKSQCCLLLLQLSRPLLPSRPFQNHLVPCLSPNTSHSSVLLVGLPQSWHCWGSQGRDPAMPFTPFPFSWACLQPRRMLIKSHLRHLFHLPWACSQ